MTDADSADVERVSAALDDLQLDQFGPIATSPPSENRLVQTAIVSLGQDSDPYSEELLNSVEELRDETEPLVADTICGRDHLADRHRPDRLRQRGLRHAGGTRRSP